MKKYDKIYVIDQECPSYIDPIRDGDGNALMEHEGPVIVLTVEEFRSILDDIVHEAKGDWGGVSTTHHFVSNYLKSKGLKIS